MLMQQIFKALKRKWSCSLICNITCKPLHIKYLSTKKPFYRSVKAAFPPPAGTVKSDIWWR